MTHVRVLFQAPTALHRLVLTFMTALMLIIGLLTMHTLSGAATGGHADATAEVSGSTRPPVGPDSEPASAAAGMLEATTADKPARNCAGDCDHPSGTPDHSTLMTACVLALMAAAALLLVPTLLACPGRAPVLLLLHGRELLAAQPHPRPPSLLVLSISRT